MDQVKPGEGVVIYISVQDIEQTQAKAQNVGGKIVKEKTEILNAGWYGPISDPDGKVIGLLRGK